MSFGAVAKALLALCVLIGVAGGLGYVWEKQQISRLSQQIEQRQARLAQLNEENEGRRRLLQQMRAPAFLEAKIRELNLGLVQPQPGQVWRVPEPPVQPPQGARPAQYATQDATASSGSPSNETTRR
jgi:cell division protein FtsB